MSVQSELNRLRGVKTALASILKENGVQVPTGAKLDEYSPLLEEAIRMAKEFPVGYIFDWVPVEGQSIDLSTPEKVAGHFGYGTWKELNGVFTFAHDDAHAVGSTGGEAEHTLTEPEMPSHTHGTSTYVRSEWSTLVGSGSKPALGGGNAGSGTSAVGGDQPHNNMPPYLTVYKWQRIA